MSFTDARRFCWLMKALGYPRTISVDSFRRTNFEIVADCLHWLVLRYDPAVDFDKCISDKGHRVTFLKNAAQIMLSVARIKLDPRLLYFGDGHAVKELLKIAEVLHYAMSTATAHENDVMELGPFIKAFDVKATKLLVSEITKCGASLYDLLRTEPSLQESRLRSTMMNTDMDEIELGLKEAINAARESISLAEEKQMTAQREEKDLQAKLEKRRLELNRTEKRFAALDNVRPAYMDKFEVLQRELSGLFEEYAEKFRNLKWLQAQMESYSEQEQEKKEEAERRMQRLQRRVHREELRILRGEEVDASISSVGSSEESDGEGNSFWKWSDCGSCKSVLAPPVKDSQLQHDRWMNKNGGLPRFEKEMLDTHSRKGQGFETGPLMQLRESEVKPEDSVPISPIASDISGDFDDCDDQLMRIAGMDIKDEVEISSSDGDF